ncbi:hypothetical protein EST38_g7222 [Candolleomyces aberdarensis]|uniref:Uncharacterized protein n=1 Tax=Candolleomyces aberdarensis TaxID=2316362 RepID=A0A4Q2DHJ1_9AGAR|nr:hypothetical protein EST38_g7222 [Candolleomyces aberdarensis]
MRKTTRQSNQSFKGGELLTKYDRRPTADVQAEKTAKASEKAKRVRSQAQGAKRAAQLEYDALQKAAAQRAKPGLVYEDTPSTEKETRKRVASRSDEDDEPEGASALFLFILISLTPTLVIRALEVKNAPKRKKKIQRIIYEDVTDEDDSAEGPGSDQPQLIVESEDSGEEFVPEEDESDDNIELEEEEPDTVLETKRKKKANMDGEKKGVTARALIRELRDDLSTEPDVPGAKSHVRKERKKKAKGKGKSEPSGLRFNWENEGRPLMPAAPSTGRRGTSSVSSDFTSPSPTDVDGNDEGPAQQEGGLVDDDDDEIEYRQLTKSQYKARQSTIKVESLSNAPKIFKKASKSAKRPKVGDLPQEARANWRLFKVVIVDTAGALGPWEDISDHTIEKIWNALFENKGPCLIGRTMYRGREEYERFQMVKALTRNQVLATEWKNRFAVAGVEAVTTEWDRRELNTADERSEWVRRMLGPEPTNRQSKQRPFLWQATDREEWKGEDPNTAGGGLFLGRMILKVFAEHLSFVSDLSQQETGFTPSSKPRGALMMAIQAVNRALEYSLDGRVKIPPGNDKTGHFSEDNWGDYEKLTTINGQEGQKQVKRATVFAKTIDAMDERRWARIIEAAKSYIGKRDPDRFDRAKVSAAPLLDAEDSSDDEILHDAMFDSTAPTATAPATSQGPDRLGIDSEAVEGSGLVEDRHSEPLKAEGSGVLAVPVVAREAALSAHGHDDGGLGA